MKKLLPLLILSLWLSPLLARAAEMYLISSQTTVAEQGLVTATVYISTGGLPINNAEGTIHFPADLLSVTSISTTGSIFSLWVEPPTFSNTNGTVYFNGGIPTPGFAGNAGKVLQINFRAKQAGAVSLSLGASSILANDGSGTNVLTQTRGTSVTVSGGAPAAVVPPPTITPIVPPTQNPLPKALIITATEMPDQNSWYNQTDATFTWDLPADATAVQLVLSQSTDTSPTITYDPPITSKTLTNLADGILYLNARVRNAAGWSKVSSRKIKIDTTGPTDLTAEADTTTDDLVSLDTKANDALAGVKSYRVEEAGDKLATAEADSSGEAKFNLPPLSAGEHQLTVHARDAAGNDTATTITVTAPVTKAPKITHYPQSITVGSPIEIRGKSPYANTEIRLWLQVSGQAPKSYLIKPDDDGIFTYTSNTVEKAGSISLSAETVRNTTTQSEPSDKVYVDVRESNAMWLGTRAVELISLTITAVVLLFGLALLALWSLRQFHSLKRKLRRDLVHTEQEVHKVFALLKNDTKRRLKMLQRASTKRQLTREETKIFNELAEDLSETEKYLADKLQEIEEQDL